MRPPRTAWPALVCAVLLALAAPPAAAAPAAWGELADRIAAPWPELQRENGHFRDYVVSASPSPDRDDYGDAMLGYGLLLRAARSGDAGLRDAGLRAIRYALGRRGDVANAPFRFVALAGGYNVARAEFADAPLFGSIRARWERALKGAKVRRLGTTDVTNKSLVEAVEILELRRTGLRSSQRGTILNDPDAALRLVRRLLGRELPRAARAFERSSGRAGTTALIGDFTGAPLAYHALATGFLARAVELMGSSAPAAGRRVLRRAIAASWGFAGPDGDVSYYGRSQEQSWTLPLTAYAAARGSTRYRGLAVRAVGRLGDAYRTGRQGLFVTPALGQDVGAAIKGLDPYVAAVSYNGLTLVALDWAIGATPGTAAGGSVGADRDGALVFARGSRTFATVRAGDVWFAVKQARSDPADLRYDFGLVAVKVRDASGTWRTLPLRPRGGGTAGPRVAGGHAAGRRLTVAGDAVMVDGGFRSRGRWVRSGVRFRFEPTACGVRMTVPTRRGDDLDYSAFQTPDGRQTVSAQPEGRATTSGRLASGLDAVVRRRTLRFRNVRGKRVRITTCLREDAAAAAKVAPDSVVADDLRLPLRAWDRAGRLRLRNTGGRWRRALELSGPGRLTRPLPGGPVSLDVKLPRGARLELRAGDTRRVIERAPDWRRVELPNATADSIELRARRGSPRVAALVATGRGNRAALILHRVAALHTRTPLGDYPYGTGRGPRGELRFSDGWTTGFWPGALWRAYDMSRSRLFRSWALAATLEHLGNEREKVHDQGFRYLESSAAAYDRLCDDAATRTCRRLRASAIAAAETLLRLQRGNPGAGTIPTLPRGERCRDCATRNEAETIVDSVMNAGLLDWAHRETGDGAYRRASLRHARGVARLLVRADGSTAQAVRLKRRTGRVIKRHTHQGRSNGSTWARGQAWAVYGFAQAGTNLESAELIRVAERAAAYVDDHLPQNGVPPYDYSAPGGRPVDTSAGVITAAGLFRLADACEAVDGACEQPGRWRPLARRMRSASLRHVRQRPLGFLGDQVFTRGGSARWDDDGEFIFGTDYALEAANR